MLNLLFDITCTFLYPKRSVMRKQKNIKISSLLKLAYDELKDIGTTVVAKVIKE